jgi:hypothetical protein
MPENMLREMMEMTLPLVIMIGLFTFLSIAAFADARKKEREAYYRSEVRKKLIEQWGPDKSAELIELLKDDSKEHQLLAMFGEDKASDPRRRREGFVLAGLVTTALGMGAMIALRYIPGEFQFDKLGLIPIFVGLALLVHAALFMHVPKNTGAK